MATAQANPFFTPTQISGCQLWFDAADQSTFTYTSGYTISQWRDKSRNAYSVIQPTIGTQPYLRQASQNGLPGIQFAQNTYLYQTSTSMPNFTTGSSTSVVIAARNASINDSWNIFNTIWFTSSGGAATTRYHFSFNQNVTDGTTLYTNGALVGQVTSNAVAVSANAIVGFTASPTSQTIHTNGSVDTYAGTTLPDATGSSAFIFNDPRNNAAAANVMIFEMVGYNRQVTPAERQLIEGYLAWKWGMQANLPATHPYKNSPIPPLLSPPVSLPRSQESDFFSPTQISGCSLWLDAADRRSVVTSGFNVTRVFDKSPSNVVLSNATGFAYPVNRFNGTYPSFFVANGGHSAAGAQTLGVNAAFSLPTPFSLYIVCQHVGAADYGYVLDSGPGGSGRPYTYDGGIVNDTFATPFGEGGLVTTNPLLSVFNFASAASCYQNGSLQFTGSVSLTTGGITVGNRYSLNESWPGHICEYIMYNSVLNPAQRQQVEGYLAWKWGLQGSLPASHPYKNSLLPQLLNPPITNPIVVSGSWNPLKFTGCAFWVDAKVPAAFTPSTGGTLTAVRDLSPTPKTITITNTVTYRPNTEIVFTDTAGLFTLSGMPSAPYDYIFVGTANSSSATWRTMLRTASAPGTHPFVLQTGTNNAGMWNGSAFYQFGSLTQAPNEKSIFYGSMAADRTITASKNGTIVLTGPSPAGNESILTILGNSTGGGQPYGSLQEIVIYSRTLPTSQRQTLEGYLAWKWGLQTSLPGNHPFRNWPPAP